MRDWIIIDKIKADPDGRMAVVADESLRRKCVTENMDIPVYTRDELAEIQKLDPSAPMFRDVQKVKKVFKMARVVSSCPNA